MRLAIQMGDDAAVALPTAAAANESYKKARAMGLEDADFSGVYEAAKKQ